MPDDFPPVAGVRFRNAGKIFYFHTAGMRLEPGEYVVVETVRGPEIGKVVIAPEQVVVNELGREELKPILRLASDADIRRMDALRTRAEELLPEARRLAAEAGFPARIDAADFTLDGRRLTISFTSEDRLEYREFVRKASDRFGARVDMRQMGARDRAKLAGGYGVCGRELCCAGWLATFPAISIRMAKEQELPLNPQKISGLCGRLLCCLSYEEEGYREMRKTLPKLGQRCSTPTGEGKVIALNILRRQVTLIVEGQRVEVGDRDLGTVVRWDTSSKSAPPPPSLTREEAIEMGLIEPDEPGFEAAPAEEVDWITGQARVVSTPGAGRGRLPGGGPRKTGGGSRRPSDGAPQQGQRAEGRGRPPGERSERTEARGQRSDRGGRQQPGAGVQGAQQRSFRRADGSAAERAPRPTAEPPPQDQGTQPGPGSGAEGQQRRRRRRGRGGRGNAPGGGTPSAE